MSHRSQAAVPEAFECEIGGWSDRFSLFPAHRVEEEVNRTLRDTQGVYVQSLSIHRTSDGVCLHGVVEVDDPSTDVADIVRKALSIDHVINRMIVKQGHNAPCDDHDVSCGPVCG